MGTCSSRRYTENNQSLEKSLLHKKLPSHIISNIFILAGPCENTKKNYEKSLEFIKTGRIGIPQWIINIENGFVHKQFAIPSFCYYENKIIKKKQWKYPPDIYDYYYISNISNAHERKIYHHYYFSYDFNQLKWCLRNNIAFHPTSQEYFIYNEGNFELPPIRLLYRALDDYDILFSLKKARGKNKEDSLNNLNKWIDFERDFMGVNPRIYLFRILSKWIVFAS